jgi:hypothetical protein
MAKAEFNNKKNLFTSKLDLNLMKKLVKSYIWSIWNIFSNHGGVGGGDSRLRCLKEATNSAEVFLYCSFGSPLHPPPSHFRVNLHTGAASTRTI